MADWCSAVSDSLYADKKRPAGAGLVCWKRWTRLGRAPKGWNLVTADGVAESDAYREIEAAIPSKFSVGEQSEWPGADLLF